MSNKIPTKTIILNLKIVFLTTTEILNNYRNLLIQDYKSYTKQQQKANILKLQNISQTSAENHYSKTANPYQASAGSNITLKLQNQYITKQLQKDFLCTLKL